MKKMMTLLGAGVALAAAAQPAQAAVLTGVFGVTVAEGLRNGNGFSVADGNPFSGANTASAAFTYTGPINFDNRATQNTTPPGTLGDLNSTFGFSTGNISGYSGSGTVSFNGTQVADYGSVTGFLNSSGSSSDFKYGSYYTFNLGNLAAGTRLTITHDDGAAIFQGLNRIGNTEAGPTGVRTSIVDITSAGNTTLRYGRQNGTPSVLIVDAVAPVPEPATWATMILGFGVVGAGVRTRRRQIKLTYA